MDMFLQSVVLGQQLSYDRQDRSHASAQNRTEAREEQTNTAINLLNTLTARRTTQGDPPMDRPSGPPIPPTIELPTLNLLQAATNIQGEQAAAKRCVRQPPQPLMACYDGDEHHCIVCHGDM